jgi:adenylate cyclase
MKPNMRQVLRASWWRKQLSGGRLIGLIVMLLLCVLRASDPGLLQVARARTFDFYQQIKPQPRPETQPVSIVDLDDDSLHEIGQWPWPRTLMAQMINTLTQAGAIVIGLDIFFAEPDRLSPAKVVDNLPGLDPETRARLAAMPSNDAVFADAIRHSRVVLGQTGIGLPPRRTADIPPIPTVAMLGGDPRPLLQSFTSILRNIPELDNAAEGWGVVTTDPEADGVVRRVSAMVTDGTYIYPALSIDMLRIATANESLGIKMDQAGIYGFVVRPNIVQTDDHGRIWIYAARHDPSLYIPAKDIIKGTFDKSKVAGKLILIGTSAAGLQDIRSTAVEHFMPGVEVHAQIIDTILFNQQLSNPPDALGKEIVAAMVGALLMIILVPIIGARWTLLLFLGTAAAMAGFSWYEFSNLRTLYDPVFPIFTTLINFILVTYSTFTREEKQKRQMRGAFSRYMSPALVEMLAQDPTLLKLGGETRDMTLLFCDVRGFTTISELFDAQGLTQLINKFLTPMTNVILERRGTIDKYMGDCIMAFWNAPLDDDDHAANACRSALVMNERLGPLNDRLEQEAKAENRRHVPINIGIGLNSGPAVVGNMGSDLRQDYSVLGDTVNLASRLEGQSKTYGVTVVIGEATKNRAPDFATLELDLIKVKGKTEAVRIFTLLGTPEIAQTEPFKVLLAEHMEMLASYRSQNWEAARAHILKCREFIKNAGLELDGLYDLYEERIAEYEASPPGPDWDGVFVATSK